MEFVAIAVFAIMVIALIVAITVGIIRWVFRVDEIVSLLKNIHFAVQNQNSEVVCVTKSGRCDCCEKLDDSLTQIDSGQELCPECLKAVKVNSAVGKGIIYKNTN